MDSKGVFTISLDFELYWGTRDQLSLAEYGENIAGVERAVPALLTLFKEFEIHATWAIVGFICFEGRAELERCLPEAQPSYLAKRLNPYTAIAAIGEGTDEERYFFAPRLVEQICNAPYQEIGSHTFSHYYCLEEGQSEEAFDADLLAMQRLVSSKYGKAVRSLVFPRNQTTPASLGLCPRRGILVYRGNPPSWAYRARPHGAETRFRRAIRLADAYVNLTGHNGHRVRALREKTMTNVPASRFLRPWSRTLAPLERLRLRRILSDMTHCAKNGLLYHLWWHPENFGTNTMQNLGFLEEVLKHFKFLAGRYGMETLTMGEVADLVDDLPGVDACLGASSPAVRHG